MAVETHRDKAPERAGSEHSFGIVFTVVFALIAVWPVFFSGAPRLWSLGVAAVFLLLAFMRPQVLRPLNVVWFKFGLLLHKIISPIIMALMFLLTVVPMGLIFKILRKDPLRLRRDPEAATYWIAKDSRRSGTMRNQF